MIGICIPAHDEEAHIEACLRSVLQASCCSGLMGESVLITVVLDSCRDRTEAIALETVQNTPKNCSVQFIKTDCCSVGMARAMASNAAIERGVRWLAFTDADSTVDARWLSDQLSLDSDVVCGTVTVPLSDWDIFGADADRLRMSYGTMYRDCDGHRHVHGANMGMSVEIYLASGGFSSVTLSEDVHLVQALVRIGARIAWSAKPRVSTSGRLISRVEGGFATHLASLVGGLCKDADSVQGRMPT